MKGIVVNFFTAALVLTSLNLSAQLEANDIKGGNNSNLYLDVHDLPAGKVDLKEIAGAHQKDLNVQDKYGVKLLKYWVDETNSKIYCLAQASDSTALIKTHAEAHGLIPSQILEVTQGENSDQKSGMRYYMDIHEFGPGKVDAAAVAEAHQKDLAVQHKYGAHFLNYWVDEKKGTVMCLVHAKDKNALKGTHKEAHGLMPQKVFRVYQGE